jgi:hypothetical protein
MLSIWPKGLILSLEWDWKTRVKEKRTIFLEASENDKIMKFSLWRKHGWFSNTEEWTSQGTKKIADAKGNWLKRLCFPRKTKHKGPFGCMDQCCMRDKVPNFTDKVTSFYK